MSAVFEFLRQEELQPVLSVVLRILFCIGVLAVCWGMIRLSNVLIRRFFSARAKLGKGMTERKAHTLHSILASLVKYVLYFIAGLIILRQLGVNDSSLLALSGAVSVAVGLGAQNMIQDMLGGFFIIFEDYFGVGDTITLQGQTGTVEAITLRTTKLRDFTGAVHIIPNGSIAVISNLSRDFSMAIVDVEVDAGEDAGRVMDLIAAELALSADLSGLKEPPVVVGVTNWQGGAVTIRVTAKCEATQHYGIERELKLRLLTMLEREGIAPARQSVRLLQKSTKE